MFVGPPPDAIELMGDKLRAKAAAAAAGVPVVESLSEDEARASNAYPLLVKAAAGGGGRGMRVVASAGGLDEALAAARREAQAGFGDDRVFVERFLPRARHIEVQVIGDAHGSVVHLGERECSLQRRHQKVIEESPSPAVSPQLRELLGREAVALARAASYAGAGTVEFIADADDPATHFFLEMNARLQVEHPVTELVTGLDLVELQLRVAAGEPLGARAGGRRAARPRDRGARQRRGLDGGLPALGRPGARLRAPGAGVRVDDAVEPGTVVGTDYDSMIAKVIAHGQDRASALARLDRALAETTILGVTTTTGYPALRWSAREDVRAGALDTGLIGRLDAVRPPVGDAGGRAGGRGDRARGRGRARGRRPLRPRRRLAARRRARAVLLDARGGRRRAVRGRAGRARDPADRRRRLRGDGARRCRGRRSARALRTPPALVVRPRRA